jgi:signal transduction histidine kinase
MTSGVAHSTFDANGLRVLTHELATPLTALHAALALLADDRTDADALSSAIAAASHLSVVVSRTRSSLNGLPAVGPDGSIGSLFDEIVAMLTPVTSPTGVRLEVRVTDEARDLLVPTWVMRQVIVNLVANSLKYAPGSDVALSAVCIGGAVEVSVTDHGSGIPVEHQSAVFEPGFRLPEHLDLPGDGLGLAVNVQLLDSVGGTLRLETGSTGTTVIATIPADC